MSNVPSSVPHQVWIGNIPYESTEDELQEVLSSVGPVVRVRIRFDKDTGQSKGFAFCEYEDAESCVLAVTHLNGTMFGGRNLRIDYSSNDQLKQHQLESLGNKNQSGHYSGIIPLNTLLSPNDRGGQSSSRILEGRETQRSGHTSNDETSVRVEICRIMETLSAAHLFYILGHMQQLVLQAPELARSLLRENPSLCYALLHAQFICGMSNEPFVPLQDDAIIERIHDDECRRKMLDATYLYERHSRDLHAKGEELLQTGKYHSKDHPTPIPNGQLYSDSNSQILSECVTSGSSYPHPVSMSHDIMIDHDTLPIESQSVETVPNHHIPVDSDQHSALIDQIIKHPEILQQIIQVTPEQEALWTSQEQSEILAIRAALQDRGLLPSYYTSC